jgi:tight adherence protein B
VTAVLAVIVAAAAGACFPRPSGTLYLARLVAAGPPARSSIVFSGRPSALSAAPTAAVARLVLRSAGAKRRRASVVELCAAVAAELSAGRSAREAVEAAARGIPWVSGLADVAASPHGDVAQALRSAAELPGGEGLRQLAACWQVAERVGGGLAAAVDRLGRSLRDDEQVRREVAAQLAGPRATSLLLAVLPVAGLLMGAALGVAPWRVLLGTPVGLSCLALGLLLEVAGLVWTGRIVRAATPR